MPDMTRSQTLGCVMILNAVALFAIGSATLWWASDWMLMLIHIIGEERALGAGGVSRDEKGVLLTNPGAMIMWTLPFWAAAFVEFIASIILAVEGWRRFSRP